MIRDKEEEELSWLKRRLAEKSTWVGILLGLSTALQSLTPELSDAAALAVPVATIFEILRREE